MIKIVNSLFSMMNDFGFEDCIQGQPTHRHDGSIDALMCKGVSCQGDISIQDLQISDHFAIFSTISMKSDHKPGKAKAPTRFYEFRDLKQLDSQDFYDYVIPQISKLTAFSVQSHSADEVATRFNDLLKNSVNKFAPVTIRKTSKHKSHKYKYVAEIANAKQLRRALERKYLKNKNEVNKQLLNAQREVVRKLVDHHRALYYQHKILSVRPVT